MIHRRKLVEPTPSTSMRRQCELLKVCRSSLYYEPQPTPEEELSLMRHLDELHLKFPFYGSGKMTQTLKSKGIEVNRKRSQRLMRKMGIEGIAPKPDTSSPHKDNPTYPYLLRKLDICRVNQVWATDITYIPLAHGFAYLVVFMDWFSRRVLSWRLSNTLETTFCVEALEEALSRYGQPKIINTDQGGGDRSLSATYLSRT